MKMKAPNIPQRNQKLRHLFEVIAANGQRGVSVDELGRLVYGCQPDASERLRNSVRMRIHRQLSRLRPFLPASVEIAVDTEPRHGRAVVVRLGGQNDAC